MTSLDEHGRPEPPLDGDELATLRGFLDYQRATLEWKCSGLDAAALQRRLPPSTMTLGGMLKHLAHVEDYWFSHWLHGREESEPWRSMSAEDHWSWSSAAADPPDALRTLWRDAVARSRELMSTALDSGGLEQAAQRRWRDGRSPSLRWIVCHMIEEYARHNGHADLLRESIDGETGE